MLYIVGAVILLIIGAMIGGESGVGCVFFLLIAAVLWRVGVLGFIIRILMWAGRIVLNILKWVFQKVVYYGYKIYDLFDDKAMDFIHMTF
jgi:hypothetical protein